MQFFPSTPVYYPNLNQNAYDQWIQVNTVDNLISSSCLCFDKHEEILWNGGANVKFFFFSLTSKRVK